MLKQTQQNITKLMLRLCGQSVQYLLQQVESHIALAEGQAPDSVGPGLARYKLAQWQLQPNNRLEELIVNLYDRFPDNPRVASERAALAAYTTSRQDLPTLIDYEKWKGLADEATGGDHYSRAIMAARLLKLNRPYWALELVNGSLAIQPSSRGYEVKAKILLFGLGDIDATQEFLDEVPEHAADSDYLKGILFTTHLWSDDYDAALDVLQNWPRPYIERGFVSGPVAVQRGRAYLLAGKPNASRLEFELGLSQIEELLEKEPNSAAHIGQKVVALGYLGRTEEAFALYHLRREITRYMTILYQVLASEQQVVLDHLTVHVVNRDRSGLEFYFRAKYDPDYDRFRDNEQFKEILKSGEEWMEEIKRRS